MAKNTTNLPDAASNVKINPVTLPDGRVVSWAEAHPRPEHART